MRYRISSDKQMRRLCAEPGEEDGLDPRLEARRSGRGGRSRHAGGGPAFGPGSAAPPVDRKAAQLCRQVAVTLDEVLAECGDGVLRDLHVVDVEPFPDASRLLVTVSAVQRRRRPARPRPRPCWNTSSTPAATSAARSPRPSPASAPPCSSTGSPSPGPSRDGLRARCRRCPLESAVARLHDGSARDEPGPASPRWSWARSSIGRPEIDPA